MTETEAPPNLYANMRGVDKVGTALTSFITTYRSYMDPAVWNQKPPAYMRDLLGDYAIPSMFASIPGEPPVSPVNLEAPPHNVAHVIDAIHTDLMGILRNVTMTTSVPSDFIAALRPQDDFKELVKSERRHTRIAMKDPRSAQTAQSTSGAGLEVMKINAGLMLHCFPQFLPEITFDLKDKKGGTDTIIVPNALIERDKTIHISSSKIPGGIPLACIAWALGEASRGRIIGNDAGIFIQYMAGTQAGLTTSMKALFKALQPAIPAGKAMNDYLVMDGQGLAKVMQEEAPHMQLFRTMVLTALRSDAASHIQTLISAGGVETMDVSLKTNHGPRDTACLLFATNEGLKNLSKKIETEAESDPTFRTLHKGLDTPEKIDVLCKKLRSLADNVAACSNADEVTRLLHKKPNLGLLNSVCMKLQYAHDKFSGMLLTNTGADLPLSGMKVPDMLATSLRIIQRDLVPELQIPPPVASTFRGAVDLRTRYTGI